MGRAAKSRSSNHARSVRRHDQKHEAGAPADWDVSAVKGPGGVSLKSAAVPIPTWAVVRFLHDEAQQAAACKSLPAALVLFTAFSCMSMWRIQQEDAFGLQHGLVHFVKQRPEFARSHAATHKKVDDVNSIADFWSWMRLGLVPNVLEADHEYSEDIVGGAHAGLGPMCRGHGVWGSYSAQPPQETLTTRSGPREAGEFIRRNVILGGVQLAQRESATEACDWISDELRSWWGQACHPAPSHFNLPPETWAAEIVGEIDKTEWLRVNSLIDHEDKLVQMEAGCQNSSTPCACESCARGSSGVSPWITPGTQKVSVRFAVFNPNFAHYGVVSAVFFFAPTGRIWQSVVSETFPMDPWGRTTWERGRLHVAMIAWLLLLVRNFARELAAVVRLVRKTAPVTGEHRLNAWSVVSLVTCIGAIPLLVAWFAVDTAVAEVNDLVAASSMSASDEALDGILAAMDVVTWRWRLQRYAFSIYVIVATMPLFETFAGQPRLALLPMTLASSALDVIHFGLVMLCMFANFTIIGFVLFGHELDSRASFGRASQSTFRDLLGDSDWDELQRVGHLPAGTYVWVTAVFLEIVMLNMLIAIVMGAFSEVKQNVPEGAETLLSQAVEIYQRWIQVRRGQRLALASVSEAFTKVRRPPVDLAISRSGSRSHEEDALVTTEEVVSLVPGINLWQAHEVVQGGFAVLQAEHRVAEPVDKRLSAVASTLHQLDYYGSRLTQDLTPPRLVDWRRLRQSLGGLADLTAHGGLSPEQFEACRALVLAHDQADPALKEIHWENANV
mmetsp:Transcript_37042/g.97026  ORF Transcript_37042/g.97026 Transcript_37042/m.97026 type:complete len:785 (+) Transcript_37042:64-2418(+)